MADPDLYTAIGMPPGSRQAQLARLPAALRCCLIQQALEEVTLTHDLLKQPLQECMLMSVLGTPLAR